MVHNLSKTSLTELNDQVSWKRFYLARAKLQASSKTSALLAGFVMVSMVEVDLQKNEIPDLILVAFATCTALVVAVYLLALLVSTCILPHIEAVDGLPRTNASLNESPHVRFHHFVEMAWIFSTGVGIFLFLCQMVLLAWVRFYAVSKPSAIVMTAIFIPVVIVFLVFSWIFYKRLVSFKSQQRLEDLGDLERRFKQLDQEEAPSPTPRHSLPLSV